VTLVDWENRELPVTIQAELLSLNRSSLYYQPVPPSAEELWIKRRIDEIYTAWPFYGSRKIQVELNKEMTINRKAVQHHIREMGLSAICPGPNLSKRRADQAIFPYLLRHLPEYNAKVLVAFQLLPLDCQIRRPGRWIWQSIASKPARLTSALQFCVIPDSRVVRWSSRRRIP
jgi:hypothetical protein